MSSILQTSSTSKIKQYISQIQAGEVVSMTAADHTAFCDLVVSHLYSDDTYSDLENVISIPNKELTLGTIPIFYVFKSFVPYRLRQNGVKELTLLVRVLKEGFGYYEVHHKGEVFPMPLPDVNKEVRDGNVEIVCNNIGENSPKNKLIRK